MNIKKLFATLAGVSLFAQTVVPSASVFGAGYSQELEDAYNWAYGKSITTMSPIENANMYGAITRAEMAKMLANWAKDKGETPDTSKACNFSDTASVKGDLATAIVEACQLGLMGQGITSFRPYDTISRAEFGTALSRALWGNKYEGGTPYYTNHLNALKAAGIMTQIANAESTKEVRGYVMLMLMRSEGGSEVSDETDCEDPLVVLACNSDSDACPAACKEENKDEDEVVKSGDLDVEVSGESNGRIFIGRESELDTITLKSSEEVTITKIVLERIGYSTKDNITSVKLENDKGATIADAKTLDSKGQVKLTLKKDYKVVDGELDAVIVVDTLNAADPLTAGATVGFKVVDVESTAKNVNISGKANTYTATNFNGSVLTFSNFKNTTSKDYNFEAGEIYEVAKFKVQSPDDSSIILRGFTFKNAAYNSVLDLRKYFDKAELTIAGEKVSGLEASVNKDDELVVTFKDVEVAAKAKSEVVLKISLADDFDQFDTANAIQLSLNDFVAVDGKVESRVKADKVLTDVLQDGTVDPNDKDDVTSYGVSGRYTFKGGKIKLSNTKLGNVDAALESEGIEVAEGTITINEAIKGTFTIKATGAGAGALKQMTIVVNGEETDATPSCAANYMAAGYAPQATDNCSFTFNNVEITKSGKIKFLIDTKDANDAVDANDDPTEKNTTRFNSKTITFESFSADRFASANDLKYDESNKSAKSEVSGSISFSKVTIQPAKASMTNSMTKEVEFSNNDSNRKVVFDGTYTAKKGDVKLKEFTVASTATANTTPTLDVVKANLYTASSKSNKITFYISIDGEEVADVKLVCKANSPCTPDTAIGDTFDDVLVKAGESAKIKVEAEVEASNTDAAIGTNGLSLGKYQIVVKGEDVNGNNAGEGKANTVTLKVVGKGTVNISAAAVKETVLYKAADAEIAAFSIKPANGASETDLETIGFNINKGGNSIITFGGSDDVDGTVTVKVNNVKADDCIEGKLNKTAGNPATPINGIVCSFNEKVGSDGVNVVISLDNEETGVITVDDLEINDKAQTRTFKKRFESALAWIESMKDLGGTTQFTLGVEKDSELTVKEFTLYFDISSDGLTSCSVDPTADGCKVSLGADKVFDEGDTIEAKGQKDGVRLVRGISYKVGDNYVRITKDATNAELAAASGQTPAGLFYIAGLPTTADNYADFFKVGDQYARTYKSN